MEKKWKILEPIKLNKFKCKNRIIMGAHSYGYADIYGLPTKKLKDYVVERAKGGVGLVIMGGTYVSSTGKIPTGNPTVNIGNEIIPKYEEISKAMHENDTLILDQFTHAGGQMRTRSGRRIVAPSPIHHERTRGIPTALSIQEISEIQNDFTMASMRAKIGGLDGIELKCDQGFLFHQFLSPYFNYRQDRYGGNLENRTNFLVETIEKIRDKVGDDLIIGVRITGNSFTKGDITLIHAIEISKILFKTQCIDYLHINGATNSSFIGYLINHGDSSIQEKNFSPFAKEIKQVVDIPVIASSMIGTPEDAEDLILNGSADLVNMTRAHIADPEIINKVKNNRLDMIRYCIRCNQECIGGHHFGNPVRCIYNPAAGREGELGIGTVKFSRKRKEILVIGGGVAGMETSKVAAERGHTVHLLEKSSVLGGQLLTIGQLPYMQGFLDIVQYYEMQLKSLGVNIYPGNKVTKNNIFDISMEMDIVVIATGSFPQIPNIYKDIKPDAAFTPTSLVQNKEKLKEHILIVDVNWQKNPLAIAEFLINNGNSVTIISSGFYIGEGTNISNLTSHYKRIYERSKFLPLTEFVSHSENIVLLRNVITNKVFEYSPIDQVVFVCGNAPNREIAETLKHMNYNHFLIGDCVSPNGIASAILEANRISRLF